jgi:two-component system, chemotaxis family, chemotaxis protein CheV
MAKKQGILTESGTNEMELLVFRLGATPFGINVAKVREIIRRSKTIFIPYAPEAIEGSFKLRNQVLTLVNLGRLFNMETEHTRQGNGMTIIVEFNAIHCGVLVDEVERIYRLSWDSIQPPSQYLADMKIPVTGVANIDDKVVLIIDFETIISDVLGVQCVNMLEDTQDTKEPVSKKNVHFLIVDDSAIVRKSLIKRLNQDGYENLTVCTDGQHAWETIKAQREKSPKPFDLILTEIEMPQMDGLHLTSKIKSDAELKDIPVILFSSLITKDNYKKGVSVGADAQVSKPDSEGMMKAIETSLMKKETLVTV